MKRLLLFDGLFSDGFKNRKINPESGLRVTLGRSLTAALLVWLPVAAGAVTNGTQGGAFLLIGGSARATSMGEAFTGLADDVSAATWNPAGLSQLGALQSSLSYTAWFADTSYAVVGAGGPIAPRHALAATVYYFHVPRIENVPADVEPAVELSNYAAGLAYAWRVTGRLGIGAGVKLLSQDLSQSGRPESAASGAMVDLGVHYRLEEPDLGLGLALQNMGPSLEFRDARAPAPFWVRAGAAWHAYRDPWVSVTGTTDLAGPVDTRYRIDWPSGGIGEIGKTRLAGPGQKRGDLAVGTEWWIAGILALRGGYTFRLGSDLSSPAAGAGLRFEVEPFAYAVDYGYSFWGELSSNVSRVSFSLSLIPKPRESE